MQTIEQIIESEFTYLDLNSDSEYRRLSDKRLNYENEIKNKLNDVSLINSFEIAIDELQVYEEKLLIKFVLDFIRSIFNTNHKDGI